MGSAEGSEDEWPVRRVMVAGFELGRAEATAGQYRACVAAGRCLAEWEYAARSGGQTIAFPWGTGAADCSRTVMNDGAGGGCGAGGSWPVCSRPAGHSAQGVCDLTGNVWEWVEDGYGPYLEAPTDGSAGAPAAQGRVFRGGAWNNSAGSQIRASNRTWGDPGDRFFCLGFRLARSIP